MRILLLVSLGLIFIEGALTQESYYVGCPGRGYGRHLEGSEFCCIEGPGPYNNPVQCPDNGNGASSGSSNGGNNGSVQETQSTYTYVDPGNEFEQTAVRANEAGCFYRDLGTKCHYNQGITGQLTYNLCLHHDPRNPQCIGFIPLRTNGFQCTFCCTQEGNELLEGCSLGFQQGAAQSMRGGQAIPLRNRPRPSPRDCIGGAKGTGHCNKATGACEKYCCEQRTREPCRTPICPNDTREQSRAGNEAEQTRICNEWQSWPRRRVQTSQGARWRRAPYPNGN